MTKSQCYFIFLIDRVSKGCTVFMSYLYILCSMDMFSIPDRDMAYSSYVWFFCGIRHGCPMYIYDECVMDAVCLFIKKYIMFVCMYTCMYVIDFYDDLVMFV